MEKQSLIDKIINFFKYLIIIIIGFFKNLFGIKKEPKKQIDKSISTNSANIDNNSKKQDLNSNSASSLPDSNNIKANPHNNDDNTDSTNDIILTLPTKKIDKIKNINQQNNKSIYNKEFIEELIDEELEETYKERKFKVKDASKEIKEKIKEIKEKIVPKIITKIEKYNPTLEEIKKDIKYEVEEILEEKPLFIKKTTNTKDSKSNSDVYFVAYQKPPIINKKDNTPIKIDSKPITEINSYNDLNKNLISAPMTMIKNTNEIPTPKVKDEIKNAAIATSISIAAATLEIIKPSEEKEIILEEKTPSIEDIPKLKENNEKTIAPKETPIKEDSIELPILKELEKEKTIFEESIKDDIEKIEDIQELEEIKTEIIKKEKELDNQETLPNSKEEEKKEEIKSIIRDTEIAAIAKTTDSVIKDSHNEIKKEEFEDKDYTRIERQIDHMLNDITNTFLRYGDKLTPSQKEKLQKEEKKLRETKQQIHLSKENDIKIERDLLQGDIHEAEILGLQEELKKLDIEYKEKVSEDLLKRMDKLEGMTREQVANADKRILMNRLNKASLLLEMGSLLAFPFIRNKYFFYFTIGLIIDNHFNFINAFWKRKINRYEPADLSQIKKGQDALNGALDITFKNIVELDYLEKQAISRYPELAYDQAFINKITNIRIRLNNQYNKLMKKNKIMEKYLLKTKHQRKILQKEDKKAS